jgi:hypothetical protein
MYAQRVYIPGWGLSFPGGEAGRSTPMSPDPASSRRIPQHDTSEPPVMQQAQPACYTFREPTKPGQDRASLRYPLPSTPSPKLQPSQPPQRVSAAGTKPACAPSTDESCPVRWCPGPTTHGMNHGLMHESSFGNRPDKATKATP